MKLHRDEFQKQQVAVKKIQSVARGYISREQVPSLARCMHCFCGSDVLFVLFE